MMNDEMQKIWEALRMIYGRSLAPGTVTVLLQTGPTTTTFQSFTFPQEFVKEEQGSMF